MPLSAFSSRVQVRLGEHHIRVTENTEQFITSSRVIKHPRYSSYNINNDIMLIKLSKPATLNSYVRTVALPSSCAGSGTRCLVSGWGNMSGSGSKSPSVVQGCSIFGVPLIDSHYSDLFYTLCI